MNDDDQKRDRNRRTTSNNGTDPNWLIVCKAFALVVLFCLYNPVYCSTTCFPKPIAAAQDDDDSGGNDDDDDDSRSTR